MFHLSFIHVLIVSLNFVRCCAVVFLFVLRNVPVSGWRVSEMSENGLRMACDLRLCLHIGLFCSFSPKRKYRNDYFEIVIRNFTSR